MHLPASLPSKWAHMKPLLQQSEGVWHPSKTTQSLFVWSSSNHGMHIPLLLSILSRVTQVNPNLWKPLSSQQSSQPGLQISETPSDSSDESGENGGRGYGLGSNGWQTPVSLWHTSPSKDPVTPQQSWLVLQPFSPAIKQPGLRSCTSSSSISQC